jgi:hypothetical protein
LWLSLLNRRLNIDNYILSSVQPENFKPISGAAR